VHHLLLLMPLLALGLFFLFPWPVALPLYGFLAVGSLIGYRKGIQAQRWPPVMGRKEMVGRRAKVVRVEEGNTEVEYLGEIWKAVSSYPLHPGQEVIIEKVEGLTLTVVLLTQPDGRGRT
jgi:membrane protein implicated in regulation of membrane protease activity